MPSNSYKNKGPGSPDKGALSAYYGFANTGKPQVVHQQGRSSDVGEGEGSPLLLNRTRSVLQTGNLWTQEQATEQAKVVSQCYREQVDREQGFSMDSDSEEEDAERNAGGESLTYEEYHEKVDKIWENTDWQATGDEKKYGMTTLGAVCSLLAAIFGVGILEQPKAVQQSGFAMGMLALVISTVVSHFGGYYLGIAARMTAKKSLGEISKTAGGVFGVILSVYSLLGLCILASIGYAVSWYRYTAEVWVRAGVLSHEQVESTEVLSARSLVITVLLLVIYPVCCMRDLSALNAVSTAAAGVYMGLVVLMGYYWVSDYLVKDESEWSQTIRKEWTPQVSNAGVMELRTGGGDEQAGLSSVNHPCHGMFDYKLEWGYTGDWKALFFGLALMNTAFACHFSCVDVFAKELQKPTRKVLHTVLGWTMGISFVVYGIFTAMGWSYASKFQYYKVKADFENEVFEAMCQQGAQDKILGNMKVPGDKFDPVLVTVAQFVVFLVLFLTYPLFISASRSTIHGLVWGEKQSGFGLHMLETGALVLLTWVLAIFIPGVTTILAYAGAGPGVALVLILPSYLMLCLHKHLPWCSWNRMLPLILLVMGVIVSVGGILLTALESRNLELGANVPISDNWPERKLEEYRKLSEPVQILETGDTLFADRADKQLYWYDYEPADINSGGDVGSAVGTPTPTVEPKPVDGMEKLIRFEVVSRIAKISSGGSSADGEPLPRLEAAELKTLLKFVKKQANANSAVPAAEADLAGKDLRKTNRWFWTEKTDRLVRDEKKKIEDLLKEELSTEDRDALTASQNILTEHFS